MTQIEEELKKLPARPGVYIMHDENDTVLYVGKARSLRNRVSQYFHGGDGRAILAQLVPKIAGFETIVTDSETEALILENNLIKEYRPRYNTLLKDDKTYPYIKVTTGETYPRLIFTRKVKRDNAKYFGPYSDAGAVRGVIDLLQKEYGIRSCQSMKRDRACLNADIGRCGAPCMGRIPQEEYRRNVEQVLDFLGGNTKPLVQKLTVKMQEASAALAFEQAAEYKAALDNIDQITQRQKMSVLDDADRDIVAFARADEDAVVQVFFVRGGALIGREHFYMKVSAAHGDEEILSGFLEQYYSGTPVIPAEILLQVSLPDAALIGQWLSEKRGRRVRLVTPKKGDKEKLMELAAENARLILSQDAERLKREQQRTRGAASELGRRIGTGYLHRIEAYDISDISGFAMVGSMVVFEDGRPKKSDYRKFRIQSLSGPNDYAALEEVLTRRFSHGLEERGTAGGDYDSFTRFPDVILMDGGKGQVHIAQKVLDSLGLTIPVCGMVKDDHHRTRGLYVQDEEIPIGRTSPEFRLITQVQDEAHRFAITYHRSLRSKAQVHSLLDEIPGIGEVRRKALMREFSSIDAVREAGIEELCAVPGMNRSAAQQVYDYFRAADAD